MKFLVFTSPSFIPDEASYIRRLFELGLDVLHLRKPGASADECARLVEEVPELWRGRIVVHDHFRLCRDYGLMGVHLNSRNPVPPADFRPGTVSASCHSLAEVARRKTGLSYVTLSPVFDSISKQGYRAAYSEEDLERAAADGSLTAAWWPWAACRLATYRACAGGALRRGHARRRLGGAPAVPDSEVTCGGSAPRLVADCMLPCAPQCQCVGVLFAGCRVAFAVFLRIFASALCPSQPLSVHGCGHFGEEFITLCCR